MSQTRSKTKLRLVIDDKDFVPPHRSTQQFEADPFSRQPRSNRSPPSTPANLVSIGDTSSATDRPPLSASIEPPHPLDTGTVQEINSQDVHEGSSETQEDTPSEEYQLRPPRRSTASRMANTTLQESMAAHKIPATPQFLCPPLFNPCTDDALQYLKQYERTSAANGWNNTLKITYLPTFLEGAANKWFERYKEQDHNSQITWADIKEDFLEEFGAAHPNGFLEGQLYERKQKENEGIREYYYSLLDLYGEYNPDLDLREFRKFFENGMKKKLYPHYRLVMEDEPSWRSFKRAIDKLGDIIKNSP